MGHGSQRRIDTHFSLSHAILEMKKSIYGDLTCPSQGSCLTGSQKKEFNKLPWHLMGTREEKRVAMGHGLAFSQRPLVLFSDIGAAYVR